MITDDPTPESVKKLLENLHPCPECAGSGYVYSTLDGHTKSLCESCEGDHRVMFWMDEVRAELKTQMDELKIQMAGIRDEFRRMRDR